MFTIKMKNHIWIRGKIGVDSEGEDEDNSVACDDKDTIEDGTN